MKKVLTAVLNAIVNTVLAILGAFHLDSPNRIVLGLSPLLVGASGWVVTEFATFVPGVHLTKGQVTAVFIVACGLATTKLLLWLHGWQQHEKRQAQPPLAAGVLGSAKPADIGTA